jgi:hypothetical protein
MRSNLLEQTVADVLAESLGEAEGELFVVNPGHGTVEELVNVMGEIDTPTVRLIAAERTLKDVMGDFLVASTAADLVDGSTLEMRTHETDSNTLLVTEESVVAIVEAGDRVAGLVTDDEEFIESAYEMYSELWEESEPFGLRTPAISRVRTSLESDIGPETATDFGSVLASLETARGDGEGLDEVTISLLVAAKNRELLYDISKWGEDVGIASKATFSRTKTKLEDLGLIDTEKVPIDVGRPRLRLMLGDDRLRDAEAPELASVTQSILAQAS